ncbi:MAG: hypothetical protein ACYDAQ_16860 [Mycobacteriales bacterium]
MRVRSTALGAFTSKPKADGVVLRSKTPDGALQECWTPLCAYHAIRGLIVAASTLTRQDPLRISFGARSTRYAARSETGRFPLWHKIDEVLASWLSVLAKLTNPHRGGGGNPRQARRSHRCQRKPASPTKRWPPLVGQLVALNMHPDRR